MIFSGEQSGFQPVSWRPLDKPVLSYVQPTITQFVSNWWKSSQLSAELWKFEPRYLWAEISRRQSDLTCFAIHRHSRHRCWLLWGGQVFMLVLFRALDPRAWSGVGCFVHSVIQGHSHVKGLSGNTTVHGRWGGSRRCAKFCLRPTQVCLSSQIKGICFLNFPI